MGPTRGVPWDYVAPHTGFYYLGANTPVLHARASSDRTWVQDRDHCPYAHFFDYWTMLEHALPIDRDAELETRCTGVLNAAFGSSLYDAYMKNGYLQHPQLLWLQPEYTESIAYINSQGKYMGVWQPESTPLAAWVPDVR